MRTPKRTWRFHFGGHPSRVPEGWVRLDAPLDNEFLHDGPPQVGLTLAGLREAIGRQPPARVEDLFTIAVAVYTADRRAPRRRDGKPRRFELNIPVSEPDTWNRPQSRALLCALLGGLSGDEWTVQFRQDVNPPPWQSQLLPAEVEAVALFSGGLDSFCHAGLLRPTSKVVLVSHGLGPNLRERKRELRAALGGETVLSAEFQVRINAVPGAEREPHPRTRALLLLAAGVLVCAANGVDTLHCPENGLLALHPAKAPLWSQSATPIPPMTVHLANALLDSLDVDTRVVNPYAELTKGEVCERAVDAGWRRSLLGRTITCVNPDKKSSGRFGNCGYCRHCLVRHAALVRVGGDLTEYRDVYPPEIPLMAPGPHDKDLRALRVWLGGELTAEQLAPLPPEADAARALAVVERARLELADIYRV